MLDLKKKKVSDWYSAATHYLTAGFIIPFLIGIVFGFLSAMGEDVFSISGDVIYFVSIVVTLISIWFGVMYSASYLRKAYHITNKERVIRISTAYLVIIQLFLIYQF